MKVTVMIDGQSFDVEIQDINKRPIVAIVDGETFEIQPEVGFGAPGLAEPTPAQGAETTIQANNDISLLAPLPGTVTEIFVLPGAQVEAGQAVCVIEAMKMKNTIHADRSGTVTGVPISLGQLVKHKQVLVEFAE